MIFTEHQYIITKARVNEFTQAISTLEGSYNSSGTNWEALAAMSDDTIDYSDIPPLTDEFFERATLRIPAALTKLTLAGEIANHQGYCGGDPIAR